jgi:hypothetical protein
MILRSTIFLMKHLKIFQTVKLLDLRQMLSTEEKCSKDFLLSPWQKQKKKHHEQMHEKPSKNLIESKQWNGKRDLMMSTHKNLANF